MTREIDPRLVDSRATHMLNEGLARASTQEGLSLRKVAARLGYKQAVVLSHMATGRVPIPIDRAEDIAEALEIDPASFLQAVVEQRHPDVSWSLLGAVSAQDSGMAHELAVTLGKPLRELSTEQRAVMREVAAEPSPRRRWISVHELVVVETLRQARPRMASEGLEARDLDAIRTALRSRRPKD